MRCPVQLSLARSVLFIFSRSRRALSIHVPSPIPALADVLFTVGLFSVTVCQALFIAPCSHAFHYKCIRPLLTMHHPGFNCPLCRTFADLNADVEVEVDLPPTAPPADEHTLAADRTRIDVPPPTVGPDIVDLTMDEPPTVEDGDADEDEEQDVPMRTHTIVAPRRSMRRNRSAPNLADETDADVGADSDVGTSVRAARRGPVVESDAEELGPGGATNTTLAVPPPVSPLEAGGATLIGGLPSAAMADFGAYFAAQQLFHGTAAAGASGSGRASGSSRERDPDEMEVEIEMAAVESDADGGSSGGANGRSVSKRRRR